MHARATDIAAWLRNRLALADARGLVVGLGGDVDSAVVAALCRLAAGERALAVILTDPNQDDGDAALTADALGIPAARIDVGPAHGALTAELTRVMMARHGDQAPAALSGGEIDPRLPFANVEARLRMASVYFFADSLHYLVAGAANRCELAIGNVAKYGDGGADLFPVGHLLASEVRALARDLGVPEAIIDKPRRGGEWIGRTDDGEGGFTYADLERYLSEGPAGVPPALALRVERLMRQTEQSRAAPEVPDSGNDGDPQLW